jgi:hypothetical protein
MAIRKVTSDELLTKQTKRKKKLLYAKKSNTLKLLLNVVTAGSEALVASRNEYLHACVKKSAACDLSQALTPSINSSLLLKCCDPNQFSR